MCWLHSSLCIVKFYVLYLSLFSTCFGMPDNTTDLRQLLQNHQENQDLIANLGTRYEVVYPLQYRPDWVRGLSTRSMTTDDTVVHLSKTSLFIETHQFKFHLDLELNTNLLSPTLVQTLNLADSQLLIDQEIENCYYHATIRNDTTAVAAFRTCNGISGVIHFKKEVFVIHPLYGGQSINHPHLLFRHFPEDNEEFTCGNDEGDEKFRCLQEHLRKSNVWDAPVGNKYIELALILDKSFFEKYNSQKDVIAEALQIVNCADLHYRLLNTSISVVYLELWAQDQIDMESNVTATLDNFQEYVVHKLSRISVDASHLLTGFRFSDQKKGLAIPDSICTVNAVGISKVDSIYKPHVTSLLFSHMLGHNLGMYHDHSCCECSQKSGCVMSRHILTDHPFFFSSCSMEDYFRTLRKGYGVCLFNMPMMRESICGNGILEKEEECDCGTSEECLKFDSCCDPITCKFIKHAQCSSGSCCKKCKLLSTDHMCRSSKGECDIPEFCDGYRGQCPEDLYRKNGAACNGGIGYCYLGHCPSIRQQCENFWGYGADTADSVCYERLNVQGTPNGNCGPDDKGSLTKCPEEDSHCGSLQCHQGQKAPVSDQKPIQFVVNKINLDGQILECKVIPSTSVTELYNHGMVADGTKCGYQKFCVNRSCISVKNVASGSCPLSSSLHLVCSGHGVCTNINTCICEEGWTGSDCGETYTEGLSDAIEGLPIEMVKTVHVLDYKSDEDEPVSHNFKGSLIITVAVSSVLIGLALIMSAILVFMYSKNIFGGEKGKLYQ